MHATQHAAHRESRSARARRERCASHRIAAQRSARATLLSRFLASSSPTPQRAHSPNRAIGASHHPILDREPWFRRDDRSFWVVLTTARCTTKKQGPHLLWRTSPIVRGAAKRVRRAAEGMRSRLHPATVARTLLSCMVVVVVVATEGMVVVVVVVLDFFGAGGCVLLVVWFL